MPIQLQLARRVICLRRCEVIRAPPRGRGRLRASFGELAAIGSEKRVGGILQVAMNGAAGRPPSFPVDSMLADKAWSATFAAALATDDADPERPLVQWSPVSIQEESVERAELRLEPLDAFLALDEPYLSAVVLRYPDGSDLTSIAKRTADDEATAEYRLATGIARLRRALRRTPRTR